VKKLEKEIDVREAIKNLLIISLLKQDVHPRLIEIATGMAEKTIRNKFPTSLLGKKVTRNDAETSE
jgi:hypothetical protein